MTMPDVTEILKALMVQRALNTSGLARLTGLNVSSLSRILNGKSAPSFDTMAKLADALGVELSAFTPRDAAQGIAAAQAVPGHTMIQAVYSLEDTALSPLQAAQLLEQAANGAWVSSAFDPLADPDAPRASVLNCHQVGSGRMEITLGFPHAMIENGSIVGALSVAGSALTGTGARLLDLGIPTALLRTYRGPRLGLQGIRDQYSKHGRPLLAATIRPMAGLSPRQYGRAVFEALQGGADFTADATLLHSLPNASWQERARYAAEAVGTASRNTNEGKVHLLNITASTVAQMEERALWARDLDLTMVMVDAAAIGWAGLQSLAAFCAKEDLGLAAMGGRSLFGDMLSEQLQAKLLRLLGADIISTGSPLRGNVSNRRYVQGVMAALRDKQVAQAPEGGHFVAQDFGTLGAAFPAVGGGHNPWHFARLLDAVGPQSIFQCGSSMFGHPQGLMAGATACRTAIDALVQARHEGLTLAVEGRNILQKAARFSGELRLALEHFQEGNFLFGLLQQAPAPLSATVTARTGHPSPPLAPRNVLTPFRRPSPGAATPPPTAAPPTADLPDTPEDDR